MMKRLNPIHSCSTALNKYASCCADTFILKYSVLGCYPHPYQMFHEPCIQKNKNILNNFTFSKTSFVNPVHKVLKILLKTDVYINVRLNQTQGSYLTKAGRILHRILENAQIFKNVMVYPDFLKLLIIKNFH